MPTSLHWDNWIINVTAAGTTKSFAQYQDLIDKGEFDAVESLCMEQLEKFPSDVEYYLPAYRLFIKRKEADRAGALLQLHVDCLRSREDVASENALLQKLLLFWPDCSVARNGLIGHLKLMYGSSPHFDELYKKLNVATGEGLDTLKLFEAWLRFDEGRIVYMPSKGVGRVREVNLSIQVIRVIFNKEQMSFKIDEIQRLCVSLSQTHFLYKKVSDPQSLITMAESQPGELLNYLFTSVNRPLPLNELRDMLAGIVQDKAWNSWWSKAKKDPRLLIGSGTKPDISFNNSADATVLAIKSQFDKADPFEKLALLQQHGNKFKDLQIVMVKEIIDFANSQKDVQGSLSLEIYLEMEQIAKSSLSGFSFDYKEILLRPSIVEIISEIKDRISRKNALGYVKELRKDWAAVFEKQIRTEPDSQCIEFIYDSLRSEENADIRERIISQAIDDPTSMPRLYLWLCKEMPSRPELLSRANASFVLSLLRILDHKVFKGNGSALRKLFDLGEAADRAVVGISVQDASRVLESLSKDNGLEDYRKDRIREEIFHYHPGLQGKKTELIYVTSAKIEEKREELQKLVKVDIPHNSLEIQRTREYGDLRENFEYHAARAKQELLSSRAKSLHDELKITRTIESLPAENSKIAIGSRVFLRNETGGEIVITILGPWDSDPSKNILSYTSAAGTAMLGCKVGQTVEYNEKKYIVGNIEPWQSTSTAVQ